LKSLKGKNALVTGAGKRIGRAIALKLASEGANIVVHYNSSAREADDLCGELLAYDVDCWRLQADFSNPDEYEKLVDTAFETAGGLDILINSASIFPENTVETITWDDLACNVQVNAWAPFYMGRSFARRATSGSIVNLLDTRIRGFDLKHVAYLLSKQMLESFTRFMALEFAPRVRVNGVAPGLILPPPGKDDAYMAELARRLPLNRHGNARDIADAVMFLISSEFITGQVIHVDGGWNLTGAKER
jgi:NAD(P)-dependent dehydrogenase (short-subunit alcohol dehydrogenase family)